MPAFDWKNRVVLVTGGTRGIGLETALSFARAGAQTVLTYLWGGSEDDARERFAAEGLLMPRILRADAGKERDTEALFLELKKDFDNIDGLISNVAVAGAVRDIRDYKLKTLVRSIEYTSWPLVSYTLATEQHFQRYPRYVVALSSFGVHRLAMHYDFVAASKAVLENLIPYLSYRLRDQGVFVNGLSCGLAQTDSSVGVLGEDFSAFEAWHRQAVGPIPFVPTPAIAEAIFALCSGYLDAMNGQILHLDNGTFDFAENRFGLYRAFVANQKK